MKEVELRILSSEPFKMEISSNVTSPGLEYEKHCIVLMQDRS